MPSNVRLPGVSLLAALLSITGLAAPSRGADLAAAVQRKDKGAVLSLLNQKADVNARQPDGATALHWAAHWNDPETADLLIRAGADVSAANAYGVTPLLLACGNGNPEIVEKLVSAGANPNSALPTGETALMTCARAGSADAVRSLASRGADVNARETEKGQTALMWAVAQKHAEVAQILIEHGADFNARSKAGFSPLMFAARVGDVESTRVLLAAGANVNEAMPVEAKARVPKDPYGDTPAAQAASTGGSEAPSQSASQESEGATGSMTPLLMASASGHEVLGIFLLENGAEPNAVDEYGTTALHYSLLKGVASMNGVSLANYVSYLFRTNMPELVKALLKYGADPNIRLVEGIPVAGGRGGGAAGATPFLLAAASGDPHIMRILAEGGADPLLTTKSSLTPLMAAAGVGRVQDFTDAEERDSLEALRLAVELGADVNAVNDTGRTALHGATNLGGDTIIQFLAEKGANLDVRDKYQQTPLSIASGVHLPWTPKGEELGEVVRKVTAELLLKLGATPLTAPNYFKPMDEDSDVYKMNPKREIPGATTSP